MIDLVNANSVSIPLASKTVQLVVTSPPYFGLRAYQAGDGEIGAEPTPDEFIEALVTVGRECWRVLRDDGVMVVNLGDSYNGSGGAGGDYNKGGSKEGQPRYPGRNIRALQVGDRMNIPHRVAAALQADGWLWRDTVIWRKKSAMPESVNGWRWERCRVKVAASKRGDGYKSEAYGDKPMNEVIGKDFAPPTGYQPCPGCPKCEDTDGLILRRGSWRTTSAHEYIFVFAKQGGYFADREAVKHKAKTGWNGAKFTDKRDEAVYAGLGQGPRNEDGGANPRNVMTFKPTPFKGSHYATFPVTLPEFFIKAFTPEAGSCETCGSTWARVVDVSGGTTGKSWHNHKDDDIRGHRDEDKAAAMGWTSGDYRVESLGFRRTCAHDAASRPAVVLDPFVGSGSTLIAARQLGRAGIGLDLSFTYLSEIARERLGLNAVSAWENGRARQVEVGDMTGTMFDKVG